MTEKILTVDDEPRFVRLVEANLRAAGYEVLTASEGNTAIDIVKPTSIYFSIHEIHGIMNKNLLQQVHV